MHTPPGFAKRFQACCDIHAVAKDVVAINDDVADVDSDSKDDLFFRRDTRIAPDHAALNLDRTGDRIHNACEFDEHPVADVSDDAPVVL